MVDVHEPRTSRLGGETRKRGFFGHLGWKQWVVIILAAAVMAFVQLAVQNLAVLLIEIVIALGGFTLLRRKTEVGDSWAARRMDHLRHGISTWTATDTYDPTVHPVTGLRALPREVGRIDFLAVAHSAGEKVRRDELAVISHGNHMYTVLEVEGFGDGVRSVREVNAQGIRTGRFLYAAARPDMPVDQIDISTRVLPVDTGEYSKWVDANGDPTVNPALVQNLLDLADEVGWNGESYRSWMVLRMPIVDLIRLGGRGIKTQEDIAEVAWDATGRLAREAQRAGFSVRQGMTPRKLGAMVRHHYFPSYEMDNVEGIESPRDGWMPYVNHLDAFEVVGPDGSSWWHATATVPRDGWPMHDVGVRWLEGVVTAITPPVLRTITAQHRVVARAKAKGEAALSLTLDQAQVLRQDNQGQISTGENEAQVDGSRLVLSDLVHNSAAGDKVALRFTLSARTYEGLMDARLRVSAAAEDIGIDRLLWHDTRHHHAHLLTAPLARGMKA